MSRFSNWLMKSSCAKAANGGKFETAPQSLGGRFHRLVAWLNSNRHWDGLLRSARPAPSHRVILQLEGLEERITPAVGDGGERPPAIVITANDDQAMLGFGESLNNLAPGVLGNDTGTSLTASLVSQPSHGTVTLNSSGEYTYTHTDLAFAGSDSFEYQASDGTNVDTAIVSVQVAQGTTTTNLSASSNFILEGQSVTLTATVTSNSTVPGAPTPSGTVVFTDTLTSTILGSVELDSFGVASLTLSSLSVNQHPISAEYSGSIPYAASSMLTYVTVEKASTNLNLTASPYTINPGESVTFTAALTTFYTEAGVPTGSVEFREGATTLATANLDGNGVATFTTNTLPAGLHTLSAFYTATGWFQDSSNIQVVSVGAGTININLPNVVVSVGATTPTVLTFAVLTAGVTTPNSGATLDPSSVTITSQPAGAQATADPETGDIIYTPGGLFSPALEPLNTYGNFQFRIGDTSGASSNIATVRIGGVVAPPGIGAIMTREAAANTNTLQSVAVNLLPYISAYDGSFGDDIIRENNQVDLSSIRVIERNPDTDVISARHGTVSVDGNGVMHYTPDFGYVGTDSIAYEVSDIYGDTTTGTVNIIVNATTTPRLQDDPLGGTMLVVDGTAFADTIVVSPGTACGDVVVTVNGVVSDSFRPSSRIVVLGYGGNDNIQVADDVKTPVWLVGGAGNDTLKGGGGPSLLLGGNGNDTLVSGIARNVLIGGAGADSLKGNGGDILVGASTLYDNDQQSLAAILRTARSGDDHGHRRHHDHCGERLVLTSADIVEDDSSDLISGIRSSIVFATQVGGSTDDTVTIARKGRHGHGHKTDHSHKPSEKPAPCDVSTTSEGRHEQSHSHKPGKKPAPRHCR